MNPASVGLLSAISLGSADFVAYFTARRVGVYASLVISLALECLVLSPWLPGVTAATMRGPNVIGAVVLYGAFTALMTGLLYWAIARGPVSVAAPIVAAHPAIVVLLGLWLGTRLDAVQTAGLAVTLLGAVVVGRYSAGETGASTPERHTLVTVLIATMATLAYAAMVISGQKLDMLTDPVTAVSAGKLCALALLLIYLPFRLARNRPRWATVRATLPLLLLQGALDAGGYLFLFRGTSSVASPIVVVASSLFGIVTTLLAWLILKERINQRQCAGILCVVLGIVVLTAYG